MAPASRTALCLLLVAAAAAALAEKVHNNRVLLPPPVWVCTRPVDRDCRVFTPEQMELCEGCEHWGMSQDARLVGDVLDRTKYVAYDENANVFLQDVLTGLYGFTPAEAERLVPERIRLLYEKPQDYGWVESTDEIAGGIMLDRRKAALLLPTESDMSSPALPEKNVPQERKRLPRTVKNLPKIIRHLIYPSAANGGELREVRAAHLFSNPSVDGVPKLIYPFIARITPRAQMTSVTAEIPTPLPEWAVPLKWNAWIDRIAEPFEPQRFLVPSLGARKDPRYELTLHLGPLPYMALYGYEDAASPELQRDLAVLAGKRQQTALTLIIATDETVLEPVHSIVDMKIDLERVAEWRRNPIAWAGDPMVYLAKGGKRTFVFGEATIPLLVKRAGPTTVGVAIWDENGTPVDELKIRVCVEHSESSSKRMCGARPPRHMKPSTPDFAQMRNDGGPEAALNVIGLGNSGVVGIFRRNDSHHAPFYVWRTQTMTEREFIAELQQIMNQFGDKRRDQKALAGIGKRLYDTLFVTGERDNDAALRAKEAFEEYAGPYLMTEPSGMTAPLLYARLLHDYEFETANRKRWVRQTPLLPLAPANAGTENDPRFLGFHFRIETPLARRITVASQPCISQWQFVVPPLEPGEFQYARGKLDESVPRWFERASVVEDMSRFSDWMSEDKMDPDAAALMVLSHYGADGHKLAFGGKSLAAGAIKRSFLSPSIAVLNGCGSAPPESARFVDALNSAGVDAVIAARHEVANDMAADYFACLCQHVPESHAQDVPPLSAVHFDAIQCLRQRLPAPLEDPYGAAALAYGLFGNGEMKLCQPAKPPQTSH
jgi:hypothetical protein